MAATDSRIVHAERKAGAVQPEPGTVWQSIWFEARRADWRILALVPAEAGIDSVAAANSLTEVARTFEPEGAVMVDGTKMDLNNARTVLDEIERSMLTGGRIIVALDAPGRTPAVIPVARTADAALLVVGLGETSLDVAREAVERVGRDLFIGSITVEGAPGRSGRT